MATLLKFEVIATDTRVFDPLLIDDTDSGIPATIKVEVLKVTNVGEALTSGLGVYIKPAINLGEFSKLSDNGPYTDFQDLLKWGTAAQAVIDAGGTLNADFEGLYYTVTDGSTTESGIFRRGFGDTYTNRMTFPELAVGGEATLTIWFRAPSGEPSKSLYVDTVVEA